MHFFSTSLPNGALAPAHPARLKHIFPYLKPYRGMIAAALLALVVTSSTVLGLGQALRYLIDEGLGKNNPALLDRAYELFLLVTLVLAAATYARFYFVSLVGERAVADIRRGIYRHLLSLDVGFFETTSTGELLSRLTTDTTLLQTLIGSSISIALRNALLLVGGFALMLVTSPQLTLYALALVPLSVAPILVLGRKVRGLSRESQAKVGDISTQAEETFGGIRTVQAFALERQESARFAERIAEALEVATRRIRARALLTGVIISLVFGAVVTLLWIGGREVIAGQMSHGELSAFVLYAFIVAGAVGALSEVAGDVQRAAGAAERLVELLEVKPGVAAPAHPIPLPMPLQGRVVFDDVSFAYPSRPGKKALEGFTLAAAPGEKIALVGPSGAGKTTVFQLLLRFYDPQAGGIRLDGIDLRALDPEHLRRTIGIVQQEPLIFSTTAEENIRLGDPEASPERIRNAAEQASALEFLDALPQGLGTYLGEKGVQLSGGQRQRIAIARAILRDPKILLLDEATSALDAENEQAIQRALEKVSQGRTTLVIAHRLSTILSADRIVVMNEGRIEAIGTHAELLRASPLYARLAALQFAAAA